MIKLERNVDKMRVLGRAVQPASGVIFALSSPWTKTNNRHIRGESGLRRFHKRRRPGTVDGPCAAALQGLFLRNPEHTPGSGRYCRRPQPGRTGRQEARSK